MLFRSMTFSDSTSGSFRIKRLYSHHAAGARSLPGGNWSEPVFLIACDGSKWRCHHATDSQRRFPIKPRAAQQAGWSRTLSQFVSGRRGSHPAAGFAARGSWWTQEPSTRGRRLPGEESRAAFFRGEQRKIRVVSVSAPACSPSRYRRTGCGHWRRTVCSPRI